MTQEQLENSISNTQIDVVSKYNELLNKYNSLLGTIRHLELLISALTERVKILEDARLRQISWNTEITNKLKVQKDAEVKVESGKKFNLWDLFKK